MFLSVTVFFSLLMPGSMALAPYLMSDCSIYFSRIPVRSANSSILATYQLAASSHPMIADCALACLQVDVCQTAVFNAQTKTCQMSDETVEVPGRLVAAPSSDFTTISIQTLRRTLVSVGNVSNVVAVWNTTAGGNSLTATAGQEPGNYWLYHRPGNVFDGNWTSLLCSYGVCNSSVAALQCGEETGVYVTLVSGPFVLCAFRVVKGAFSNVRDPMTMTIEGSNGSGSTLTLGSSWTLLYNGTTGLNVDPGPFSAGVRQTLVNNQLQFASYRILITSKRGFEACAEYAEIQMFKC